MRSIVYFLFSFITLIVLIPNISFGQDEGNIVFNEPGHKIKSFETVVDEPHKIGLFVGGVTSDYNKNISLAFGLNYRLKVMELLGLDSDKWNLLGVGASIENNLYDNNEIVVSAGAILFLSNEFWLYFYPGVRYFSEATRLNRNTSPFKDKMFWRVGLSYDIVMPDFIISPSVFQDLINEEFSLTFGVSVLYKF